MAAILDFLRYLVTVFIFQGKNISHYFVAPNCSFMCPIRRYMAVYLNLIR